MRILGIESSCDETAAAVVASGDAVLSSVVASQIAMHGKYGGVVPELASREHLRAIVPVVREALRRSATRLPDLDAIAVTVGPGLVGSLLVGLTYAKSLSFATGVPLIGVNHIEGHIHAVILESRRDGDPVQFSALALMASGGHTHLFGAPMSPAVTACSARRATMPPAKPSTRSPNSSATATPAARSSTSLAPHGDPARSTSHWPNEGQHAGLQLQRPEDRRPALGGDARHGGGDRRAQSHAARHAAARRLNNGWKPLPQLTLDLLACVSACRDPRTARARRRGSGFHHRGARP